MACSYDSEYQRNWADLPIELLGLILDRLVLVTDFIRFGAVCKPWSLAKLDKEPERSMRSCYQEPPLLLIPVEDGCKDYRCLYSIWEDKIYPFRFQIPYRRRCCGSSYGWLAFAEKEDVSSLIFSITLLNPFTMATIRLPPIMKIPDVERDYHDPEYYLLKVILSCDPCLHPKDWVAVALVGEGKVIATIRSGKELWTFPCPSFFPVMDACFYQGKLYAVDGSYRLVAIDLSKMLEERRYDDTAVTKIMTSIKSPHPVIDRYSSGTYIVALERDLILVRKIFPLIENGELMDMETTVGFKVRKLSLKQSEASDQRNTAEWVDIEDLGKFSLFLGDNESIAISASNVSNFQPNCIYYTDDCQEMDDDLPYEADDMGIFDLATGQISKYYNLEPSQRYLLPGVWIFPKFCKTFPPSPPLPN